MSPARQHRERLAAIAAGAAPATSIASDAEGGQSNATFDVPMTPAREHRIAAAVASELPGEVLETLGAGTDPEAARIALRLTHDLRRLKAIQSKEKKAEAKREMIGEYRTWCEAIIDSGVANVRGIAGEVLPTMMVWAIDIADWELALQLGEHVLVCDVALPSRYRRTAPALFAEEVADVALKIMSGDDVFPLPVLEKVDELTADLDMHDEIRAKLFKAIGFELARQAEAVIGAEAIITAAERALVPLRRAHALHERVGAKDKIKRMERIRTAAAKVITADAERAAAEKAKADAAATQPPAEGEQTDTTDKAGDPPAD